jgi:hypothetical protein
MRKLIVVTGLLLAFCAGWCFGQGETATPNLGGTAWSALTPTIHKFYLGGYVHGYGLGMMHGASLCISKYVPGTVSSMPPEQKEDYEESVAWVHKVAPVLTRSVSSSGLETTLSTFYADYRNMPVCLEQAILFSAASLSGNAATEKELSTARKAGAERGCK